MSVLCLLLNITILMPFVSPQNSLEVYFGTRVREMFARVKAVLDLIIGVKPYFLGAPEPLPIPAE